MTRLRHLAHRLERTVMDALAGPVEYRRPVPLATLIEPYLSQSPAGLRPWGES
jgi:hypothetical protein